MPRLCRPADPVLRDDLLTRPLRHLVAAQVKEANPPAGDCPLRRGPQEEPAVRHPEVSRPRNTTALPEQEHALPEGLPLLRAPGHGQVIAVHRTSGRVRPRPLRGQDPQRCLRRGPGADVPGDPAPVHRAARGHRRGVGWRPGLARPGGPDDRVER